MTTVNDACLPIEKKILSALRTADYSDALGGYTSRALHVSPSVADQIGVITRDAPSTADHFTIGEGRRFADISAWRRAQPREWRNTPRSGFPVKFLEMQIRPDENLHEGEALITSVIGPQPWQRPEECVQIHIHA